MKGLLSIVKVLFFVTLLFQITIGTAQLTQREEAYTFNKNLGRGVNFMAAKINQNQHDPYDFELIQENNFMHVRLGSRLWQHVGSEPDFIIDAAKLQEYKNAVDWALEANLMVVMDPIHYWRDYSDTDLPMLLKMWEQLATEFALYPKDRVTFEIMNEPESYEFDLKAVIHQSLAVIRDISGNEERIVIVAGQSFSTRQALIDAFDNNIVFPTDDQYLIGTFHYYDPRTFSKQGAAGNIYWAEEGDYDTDWDVSATAFDEVVAANNNWAERNATIPMPIYCGEYGIDNGAPKPDRTRWLWWIRMMSEERSFSHSIWNLYDDSETSKGLGPWTDTEKADPTTRTLNQGVLDSYRNRYEMESGQYFGDISTVEKEGSSGNGTAMFYGSSGDSLKLSNIYIARSGSYELTLRYKITGSDSAIVTIHSKTLNGVEIESKTVKLPVMDNNWVSGVTSLNFQFGLDNQIVFELKKGDGFLHVDFTALTRGSFIEHIYPGSEIELQLSEDINLFIGNKKQNSFSIYPNPTSDSLKIIGDFESWYMINTQGKKVASGANHMINTAHLIHGIYFLIIDKEKYKVIIQ